MHANAISQRSLRRLAFARAVVFFLLAVAVAAPSHAGWLSRNRDRGSPPTISGTPPTSAAVGQEYSFSPSASDPDGDRLSFRIRNMPAWARFDGSTGLLTGTPTSSSVGTYSNIQIRVSDGRNRADLPSFSITVAASTAAAPAPQNHAPTISGSPAGSVITDTAYSFKPTATDADGDRLTFSIQGQPRWATFDTSSGLLAGTPTVVDAGTSSSVMISVSDGQASATLAFSISVSQTNHAPQISGSPVTSARVSQPYAFRPTATDSDGDRLTFSIQRKPVWATFDTTDGTLYGTPAGTDVGTASNIVIGVSDGQASATLPAFSVTVSPAPTSSVNLSWRAPTSNVDGTPLTDLAGYRVYYGTASGQYSENLVVSSKDITSVAIEGLSSATTWYFAVKGFTAAGVESDYSQEASKSL